MGAFLVAALYFLASASAEDLVLKPTKTGKEDIGVVLIQGAEITTGKYAPLMKQVQMASKNFSVWVGVPEFPLNAPQPFSISGCVDRILQSMNKSGMPKTAKILFIGHSQGGVMLQDYLAANPKIAAGQVLMGSFLLAKYRNVSYPVPTMTLGGELDGLCRVTRIMEEYQLRVLESDHPDDALANFPVLVIKGLSHIQFASGPPPKLVLERDLRPEISQSDAHDILANFISSFITVQIGNNRRIGMMPLVDASHTTLKFLEPIIAAYKMEGLYHLKRPCNDDPHTPACAVGSKWSERAQGIMGGLTKATVNDTDQFHPVYQLNPIHLPHVNSKCSTPDSSCVLQTNTVTQNVYETLDGLDTGFFSTSASEMRVKMKSRQAIMEGAGYKNVDYNTSDGSSLCKEINQAAYLWALNSTANGTAQRFQKYGVKMVMGEDMGPYNAGFIWIWTPMSYSDGKDASGRQTRVVRAPTMRTSLGFPVGIAAGMHYCKLLSPARAMEWIYVDGLRKYYGING